MSKLVEKLVLDLTSKVDEGFAQIGESIQNLEIKVIEHSYRLDSHSAADTSANARVDKLEVRMEKLESRPIKWTKAITQGTVILIGVVSTLLSIAWAIKNLLL